MSLQQAALHLFRWIDGEPMDELPESEVSRFFSEQGAAAHSGAGSQGIFEALLEQPRIPEILRRWRSRFSTPEAISVEQATRFIQQVLGAFESVDFLLDYRCTGGFTEARRNQWNDYPIYRPGRKRGWGIHLTCQGAGSYNCLRRTLQVGVGDLVLLAPDAFYDYKRSGSAAAWGVYWVAFQAESRFGDLLNWPEIGAGIHHIRCKDAPELAQLVGIFQEIASLSAHSSAEVVRLRSNLLEQLLLRCLPLIPAEARGGMDRRVQTAIQYLDQHFQREVTVADVATEACISVSSLTRLFKQYTGLTVLAWRDEKRMALACEKLTHSGMRIAEIAELVGYTDQLYFSRSFRRHFGQSPTDYRKHYLLA